MPKLVRYVMPSYSDVVSFIFVLYLLYFYLEAFNSPSSWCWWWWKRV